MGKEKTKMTKRKKKEEERNQKERNAYQPCSSLQ